MIRAIVLAGVVTASQATAQRPSQPPQPATGPGGREYCCTVRETSYGSGALQYWIFEPQGALPGGSAPVVAFLHGWGTEQTRLYREWIEHLVKRGNILIYPAYQDSFLYPPQQITPNAMQALGDAMRRLPAFADRSRFALVGHSFGGVVVFNIAARASEAGLPAPKAIFSVHPGDTTSRETYVPVPNSLSAFEFDRYPRIPADTLLLVVIGEHDQIVADRSARPLIRATPHMYKRDFLMIRSDAYGSPPLISSHSAATAYNSDPPDALDYYGYWRLFDALMNAAFYNRDLNMALGGGPAQVGMGRWSDGTPVRPIYVQPSFSRPGTLNGASFRAEAVSPGSFLSIFGSGLGPDIGQELRVTGGMVERQLAGTTVLFDGIASPLTYASRNQVNAVVPYAVTGKSSVNIQVRAGEYTSEPVSVTVAAVSPAIFTASGTGTGQGAILNQDDSVNGPSNRAARGSVIQIYVTGGGPPSLPTEDGRVTEGLFPLATAVAAAIGGVGAETQWAGLAPGFVNGLQQVNVRVPDNAPSGPAVPIVLTIGGIGTQAGVTVAIQ